MSTGKIDAIGRTKANRRNFFTKLVQYRTLLLMCAPAMLLVLVFSYLPMPGLYIAFTNFKFNLGIFDSPFVGFDNFRFLFLTGDLVRLTRNTILYNLAFLLIGNVINLTVAILLNEIRAKYFRKVSQTIMLLPTFISYVLVGLFVYSFLNFEYGLVNNLIRNTGGTPFSFYNADTAKYWPAIIIFVNIWKNTGYGTIIYFAAIMGIDSEMLEAAHIDGASTIQRIIHVMIPNLQRTFIILVLLALGGIMRGNFEIFFNLVRNNALLLPNTDIIETYVWRAMMTNFNFSMGSAVSMYQSVFGFGIVLIFNKLVKLYDPDYALF